MHLRFPDRPVGADKGLPDYGAPPVVEVSLGMQFEGLTAYNSLAAADFWEKVKSEFPTVEEKPPLDPAFETFGDQDSSLPGAKIELITGVIQPRFFFVSADQGELIQLQRDRLHYNWRSTEARPEYPRYPVIRSRFDTALAQFWSWATDANMGTPAPTQCEIVYVNRIPLVNNEGKGCGLSHVFPWFSGLPGTTEDGSFQYRQRLLDDRGVPTARLVLTLRYGTDSNGEREARLTLLVRGRPGSSNPRSCLEFMDEGRKVIVHTFTDITSNAAHEAWEKKP